MKALSWNCRGLARPSAIQAILAWVKKWQVDCVFLMETKIGENHMRNICKNLHFDNGSYIPSVGIGGGFCLLWNNCVNIKILKKVESGFVCRVNDHGFQDSWHLFAVYGTPYADQKSEFWENLADQINSCNGPWALMGDLNVILAKEDKSGGRCFAYRDGSVLRNFLFSTGGVDLGFIGCKYTWQNKRGTGRLVKERIDRVIVDTSWLSLCPKGGVRNLPIISSDHGAILLDSCAFRPRGPRPFRFFEAWFSDLTSLSVIKEAWSSKDPNENNPTLMSKLVKTQNALRWWSKNVFGDCDLRIKQMELELQTLQSKEANEVDETTERRIQDSIMELWSRKESMWKQRSRELWLS
ncbi:uncharacterized protein LOC115713782 [Cannabis sativa]|uniref:uncharacterized protein LOC115713782 n=1 Tax=Cannabis sativa TaxID=3483 RepID=UPI0011DFEA9A|nr:uncharacterized protein LOC115713782 [Cannabis sativa]